MKNIFSINYNGDQDDRELVQLAQKGSRAALETLTKKHQEWLYNIALRMIGRPEDAQDVTQEILVKMITRLSTFRQESSFRTWLYRIATNHILNMKRCLWERMFRSFDQHDRFRNHLETSEFNTFGHWPVENDILIAETKTQCLTGMLLCLDRTQRLALILGSIFGVSSQLGGEMMDIRPDNFRQILSRARKQLSHFMNDRCGLMNENNPCRCINKTKATIKAGLVDPKRIQFNPQSVKAVEDFVTTQTDLVNDALELKMQNLFRNQPMNPAPDMCRFIHKLLSRKEFRQIIDWELENRN